MKTIICVILFQFIVKFTTASIDSIAVTICHDNETYPFDTVIHVEGYDSHNRLVYYYSTDYFYQNNFDSIYNTFTYNTQGQILTNTYAGYFHNGLTDTLDEITYSYDSQGRILSKTEMIPDISGVLQNYLRYIFNYNTNGDITDFKIEDWNSSSWKTIEQDTSIYDLQFHLISKNVFIDSSGTLVDSMRYLYAYNAGGDLINFQKQQRINFIWSDLEHYNYNGLGLTIDSLISPGNYLNINTIDSSLFSATNTYYNFISGNWFPSGRIRNYYNSSWSDTAKYLEAWSGTWVIYNYISISLNLNNSISDSTSKIINNSGVAINGRKFSYSYNLNSLEDTCNIYYLDSITQAWIYMGGITLQYDALNRVILIRTDTLSPITGIENQYNEIGYDTSGNMIYNNSQYQFGGKNDGYYQYDSNHHVIHSEQSTFTFSGIGGTYYCDYYYLRSQNNIFIYPPINDTLLQCAGDTARMPHIYDFSPYRPVTYSWLPHTGLINPAALNPGFITPVNRRYYLTVTDSFGDIFNDTVFINVITPIRPVVDTNGTTTFCTNNALNLFVGNYISTNLYTWYSTELINAFNSTDTLILGNNFDVTQHHFYVQSIDTNGCRSNSDTVYVNGLQSPFPKIKSRPVSYCLGDTITLYSWYDALSYRYQWKLNNVNIGTNSDTAIHQIISNGNYSLFIIDTVNQCTAVDSFDVAFNSVPAAVIAFNGDSIICNNKPIKLYSVHNDTTSMSTWNEFAVLPYYFSQFSDTIVFGNATYMGLVNHVYLTKISGACISYSDTLTIPYDYYQAYAYFPNGNYLCAGDSLQIISPQGSSWLWSTGDTTSSIYVNSPGIYNLISYDTNFCTDTLNAINIYNYNATTPPVINLSGFSLITNSGIGIQWYFNGNSIPGANSNLYLPLQNGNYTVSEVDTNGCTVVSLIYNYTLLSSETVNITDNTVVFPNPFYENTMIYSNEMNFQNAKLEIYGINTSLCKTIKITAFPFKLTRDELLSGVYIYYLIIEKNHIEKIFLGKIIIMD